MSFAPPKSLSTKGQDRLLGTFVLLALSLVVYLVFQNAAVEHQRWIQFSSSLSSSYGLNTGAPIKLNGVSVGKVDTVTLDQSGAVALTVLMDRNYRSLYRDGSVIKVDSTLGLDSVLSGVGLIFISGHGDVLEEGAVLVTQEPRSLDDLIQEWDIEALSTKVGDILVSLDGIVSSVNDNQDNLSQSLENVAEMTSVMAETSKQLPAVLSQLQNTLATMESTMSNSQGLLQNNLVAFEDVAKQSGSLMTTLNTIATQVEPTTRDLPQTQALLDNLLWQVDGLTKQLRQHWLLQSDEAAPPTQHITIPNNALFPPDASLYQDEDETSSAQGEKSP